METTRITQHNVVGIYYGRQRAKTCQTVDVTIMTAGGMLELTLFSDASVVVPIVEIEEPHGTAVQAAALKMKEST